MVAKLVLTWERVGFGAWSPFVVVPCHVARIKIAFLALKQ